MTPTTCAHCGGPVARPVLHHPDREGKPDKVVLMHAACHVAHHSEQGDFRRWGAKSSGAGLVGYQAALRACPWFHEAGGEMRAATATRDECGRFVAAEVAG
jgi:hypothetical protein